MTELRLAADMAYPIDFGLLPQDVEAVLGYVGGYTPHIWSDLEVESAQRSGAGRQWWPIVTFPERALKTADGWQAAATMLAALPTYGLSKTTPMFVDCEHSSWAASPVGARAAIDGFKAHLLAAGCPNAFAYVPLDAGFDWVADWDNTEPGSLPAGWVGKQFGGNARGGAYDLSVFDARLWDMAHGVTVEPTAPSLPDPAQTEDDDMATFRVDTPSGKQFIVPADLAHKRWIPETADTTALANSKVYVNITLSDEIVATIPDATNQS